MKMIKIAWIIFAVCILLLTGCRSSASQQIPVPVCRVVTQVTVTYENGPIQASRCYTSGEKMQQILNYLRLIDPYGHPDEDPETSGGSSYHIILSYSDGCEKVYKQKSDRFLKEGSGPWKKIDPTEAEELGRLMGRMESDAQ